MMYEYEEASNPLNVELPNGIDDILDNIPVVYPYVPRFCKEQGHMLIWYGTKETDPDIEEDCLRVKTEAQWITCKEDWKIEKAVVLLWPYGDEVIIGAVKYPGYMKRRSKKEIRALLRSVWADVIEIFGDRKIICPSGTYLECIHMYMNQMKISHEAYHHKMMKKQGFKRFSEDFWIREPNEELACKN
jgi:hypothetical protein